MQPVIASAAHPAPPEGHEQAVLAARLQSVFQALPNSLVTASVLALLTGCVLSRYAQPIVVWCWAAALLGVNGWRVWVLYRYRRQQRVSALTRNDLWPFRRLFLVGCTAAGMAWGLLPILVFPAQSNLRVFIAFVLAGTAAGAVTSLAVERAAAFGFVVPCVLPLAVRLVLLGDAPSIAMGIMVVMFLIMIGSSVNRMSAQLRDLVSARMRADLHAQDLEQAQAHLNTLNGRLTIATRAGKIGIWEWNMVTNELLWDDAMYEIYHVDPSDALLNYETWRQRIHPQDIARTDALMSDALKAPELLTEFRVVWPDGTERHIKTAAIVQRTVDGTPLKMIGMSSDITELKDVGRMKNEFVSIVSHELRTPLTALRGALGLLAGRAAVPASKTENLIGLANRNAERLAVLIDDLLDMEKIECGKMRFDMHWQPLRPLLEQAVASNATYAAMHGVSLRLPPVWNAGEVEVDVDTNRFLQVMANLLSNAAKFSPAGSSVEIHVSPQDEDRVRILVSDHGSGIAPEFQKKLFGKFCQSDSTDNRTKSGSGLGLAISKAIVEQMHGAIGFETSTAGSTFFVELPLRAHDYAKADDVTRTTIVPLRLV